MALDKDRNIWSTNNYEYNINPFTPVCGGEELIKFTPTGSDAPEAQAIAAPKIASSLRLHVLRFAGTHVKGHTIQPRGSGR